MDFHVQGNAHWLGIQHMLPPVGAFSQMHIASTYIPFNNAKQAPSNKTRNRMAWDFGGAPFASPSCFRTHVKRGSYLPSLIICPPLLFALPYFASQQARARSNPPLFRRPRR